MIPFAPITLETKELFSKYASTQVNNCDAAFANIFCWQQTYHSLAAEVGGCLVIRYRVEGSSRVAYMLLAREFTAPLLSRTVPLLEADARQQGQTLRITGLPSEAMEIMRSLFGDRFACSASRDSADYLYNAADLRELPGRKYQPKRNHINRFNDFYSYTYEPLAAAHKEECMQLESLWQSHHRDDDGSTAAERMAIERAFDNFGALGLSGGLLRIDGRPAAFTYGSPVNDRTFVVHVEKADTSFEGIFPAINRLFAQSVPAQYEFINREEDMGLDGLRRSKLSYHPVALEYKHTALELDDDDRQVRRLWSEVFGDERSFIDKFLTDRELYGVLTLLRKAGEEVVAMLHIVPMADDGGNRHAYIYAVATDPRYRRHGLATALMNEALAIAKGSFDTALLIPGDDYARQFYARLGFVDTGLQAEFASEFDFGTGDPSKNRVMALSFSQLALTRPLVLTPLPNPGKESCR